MKVIIPTTPLIERVIGRQKRIEGQRYRLMTYVVQQPVDDGVLLYRHPQVQGAPARHRGVRHLSLLSTVLSTHDV